MVLDSNPTGSPPGSPPSPDNGPEMDLPELPLSGMVKWISGPPKSQSRSVRSALGWACCRLILNVGYCIYPAFMETPILLPQPVPATSDAPGAPLSRSDQVGLAARARNTQRAYLGHWTRFHSWAQEQGLDLPEGLEAALCDYLVRLAEDGKRMATIR